MNGRGGPAPPLPVCDRCRHFVVRDTSVTTCGPCRKAYLLQVSVRNVIPPGKDESAVVFYEGCFGLLTEREKGAQEKRASKEEKPQDKPEKEAREPEKSESPRTSNRPAKTPDKPTRDQQPPLPSRPSASSKGPSRLPLPPPPPVPAAPEGSTSRGYSSQTVRVPRPSHCDPDPLAERSEKKVAASSKRKSAPPAEEEEVEVEPEKPSSAKKERSEIEQLSQLQRAR